MNTPRSLLLSGFAIAGLGCGAAGAATFTPVPSLPGAVTVNFGDASGTVFNPGVPASYATGGVSLTIASSTDVLERNDQGTYIDSNFAPGTKFINQCGYTGLLSCDASGAVTIRFAVPTAGFTVSADDFDTTQVHTFTAAAYSGSTLLGTVTASSLADNGASPATLAAQSSTGITSVVVSDPTGNFALANIGALGGSAVPEPASLVLLAGGVAAAAGIRRRRAAQR